MTHDDQGKDSTGADGVKMLAGLVKPLVWQFWTEREPAGASARFPFGKCEIVSHPKYSDHKLFLPSGEVVRGDYTDLKPAAQADCTARVLAAIDTDAIAELVRCGNVMANALRGNYIVPGSAAAWNAALARLGGPE